MILFFGFLFHNLQRQPHLVQPFHEGGRLNEALFLFEGIHLAVVGACHILAAQAFGLPCFFEFLYQSFVGHNSVVLSFGFQNYSADFINVHNPSILWSDPIQQSVKLPPIVPGS